MLSGLSWLALEVKYLPVAREFYGETLGMRALSDDALPGALARTGEQTAYGAGETAFVLRRPRGTPRGGVHTHFAFSIPHGEYDEWWRRLEATGFDLEEHTFGSARSLYLYDPDGNCVELGQQDVAGPGIDGVFEVVLEVADLDAAEAFYADLGFDTVDRGDGRTRVRMHGPMALELWEPHLGLADARGGVHVDLGFPTPDPVAAVKAIDDRVTSRERLSYTSSVTDVNGAIPSDTAETSKTAVRVQDPDGHVLTFHEA